ncbi:MAG TPA: hypothetical protein VNX68_06590 [Nitrosopumilaceae archaeon]|nr:hypothetical protein [Nitrosopumilaceae archaeon]
MAYELVKSIHRLIQQGIGDAARLEYILDRIEKGKDLYSSDKTYLDNLLYTNEMVTDEQTEIPTESHSVENLDADIKRLNAQLENILKNKQKTEKTKSDHNTSTIQTPQKTKSVNETIVTYKSEVTTLVLAVVLGLVSLQGIGHIYIGKIARGVGILVLSLLLSTLSVSYLIGIKISVLSFTSIYFLPALVVGYFVLYVFQILDGRKLCVVYNEYFSEHNKIPPWW